MRVTRVTRALDMSASGLSLFANFRPFFVSHYEGSEELCRENARSRHVIITIVNQTSAK